MSNHRYGITPWFGEPLQCPAGRLREVHPPAESPDSSRSYGEFHLDRPWVDEPFLLRHRISISGLTVGATMALGLEVVTD